MVRGEDQGALPTWSPAVKEKWASMQKLLSSRSRLEQIVADILLDFDRKQRLADGRQCHAGVLPVSIRLAKAMNCSVRQDLLTSVPSSPAISPMPVTSKDRRPVRVDRKAGEIPYLSQDAGELFGQSEDEAGKRVESLKTVKQRFIKEPGMWLLIVVDQAVDGFDAPSATYLYIDKRWPITTFFKLSVGSTGSMVQIREYGYIVDYKDLFRSLRKPSRIIRPRRLRVMTRRMWLGC